MSLHADICGGPPPSGGPVTLRQLRVLIDGLPPTSALHRTINGHDWRDETYLLAIIADLMQASNAQVAALGGGKGVKRPKPVPRPKAADTDAEGGTEEDRNAQARAAHRELVAKVLPGR